MVACSTVEVGNANEEFKPAAPNIACPPFLPVKRECEKSGLNSVRDERFLLLFLPSMATFCDAARDLIMSRADWKMHPRMDIQLFSDTTIFW